MIIIIVIGAIVLVKNLVFETISYKSFIFPVLYFATGGLGLSYLKYRDDTYATIFKVLIWLEIIANVIATVILIVFSFILGSATCQKIGRQCITQNGVKTCSDILDCSQSNLLGTVMILFIVTALIYIGVTVLMCVTLSHFKKFEEERKSHHYSGI